MGEFEFLLNRPVIITCAIAGAAVATMGPYMLRKCGLHSGRAHVVVVRAGHIISWLSVALFIVAGFLSDR
jgi:hypothetical protein